jgi:hypothetical protein
MSRYAAVIGIIGLAILSACSDRVPTAPDPSGPVLNRASRGDDDRGRDDRDSDDRDRERARVRRYVGGCATTVEPLSNPGDPVQRLHIDGVCQVRPLGRTTLSAEQTVTPAMGPDGPFLAISTMVTYTTPNGDQVFATFEGTGTLPNESGIVCFSGTETFTGGTGRFAGASGSATTEGCASVITNRGSFSTRGSIRY